MYVMFCKFQPGILILAAVQRFASCGKYQEIKADLLSSYF